MNQLNSSISIKQKPVKEELGLSAIKLLVSNDNKKGPDEPSVIVKEEE
jgi:hypothetical protein